jgi:hypothetical protein
MSFHARDVTSPLSYFRRRFAFLSPQLEMAAAEDIAFTPTAAITLSPADFRAIISRRDADY